MTNAPPRRGAEALHQVALAGGRRIPQQPIKRQAPYAPKELRPLIRRARKLGWTVVATSRGHLRWFAPDGRLISTSGGTSNGIGVRCALVQLKRGGLS
jgi:hypothetical protein